MTVDKRAEDVMIRLQRTSKETRQEGIIRRAITEAIEADRASRECCKAAADILDPRHLSEDGWLRLHRDCALLRKLRRAVRIERGREAA